MAIFRCKRSGNTVRFTNENDIDGMRKHEGYEEVLNETDAPIQKETYAHAAHADEAEERPVETRVLKKRGRPPKATEIVEI